MKTVWVLGAGASYSNSGGNVPVLDGLPRFSYENGVHKEFEKDHEFGLLGEFVNSTFGKSLTRGAKFDFEKCLTNLEISYARTKESRFRSASEALVRLIRSTIHKAESTARNVGEYKKLRGQACQADSLDTILTFNWDTLLDSEFGGHRVGDIPNLTAAVKQYQSFLLKYSAPGRETIIGATSQPTFGEIDSGIYLKLHGSINWFSCPTQHCRNYGLVHITKPDDKFLSCTECGAQARPLIVPPTLNKNIDSNPIINKIWGRASIEMASAERIVIWGYSLPPTDFYSDWLFRQSTEMLEELVLINPSVVMNTQKGKAFNVKYLNRFEKPYEILKKKRKPIYGFESFQHYLSGRDRQVLDHL